MIELKEYDLTTVSRKSFFDQEDGFDDTPQPTHDEDALQGDSDEEIRSSTPVFYGQDVVAILAEIFSASNMTPVSVGDFLGRRELTRSGQATQSVTPESEVESAVSDRITLLAREYVSRELSTEDEARLKIATEKVRKLIPRVTAEDVEALNEILEEVEELEKQGNEQRKRLGIDSE